MPKRKNNCELKRLASELAMRNKRRRGRMQPPLPQYRYPIPKRPKVTCTVKQQEDPFDRLSDDVILFHILPCLSLRDIVKTSVLSHRWNKFWTEGIPSKLLFAFPKFDSDDDDKKISRLRPILRRGINHILELVDNKQPPLKLDELIIRFNFNPTACHPDVDTWVQIALRNNVTRLVLNFQRSAREIRYTFPSADKLLAWHASNNVVGGASVNNVSGLYNLRDVSLKSINVSGEVIECMMSNCPSLERLVVWDATFEENVRVCTKFSKLKTLEIIQCCFLATTITISSPSLVSFRYDGFEEVLKLEYVPLLSHLSIAHSCCQSFFEEGARFNMIYTSQLKKLKLSLDYVLMEDITYFSLEYPKFKNLQQLEVDLPTHDCSSFLWLINLIMAAPSLQRFSVELHPQLFINKRKPDEEEAYRILLRDIEKVRRHPSLKKIEILKFRGTSMEMELAQHLLRISPSLIQCTVTHYYSEFRSSVEKYRRQAKQLNQWLPLSAKLVIM